MFLHLGGGTQLYKCLLVDQRQLLLHLVAPADVPGRGNGILVVFQLQVVDRQLHREFRTVFGPEPGLKGEGALLPDLPPVQGPRLLGEGRVHRPDGPPTMT